MGNKVYVQGWKSSAGFKFNLCFIFNFYFLLNMKNKSHDAYQLKEPKCCTYEMIKIYL